MEVKVVQCGTITKNLDSGDQPLGLWEEGVAKKMDRSELERKSGYWESFPPSMGESLVS